MGLRLLFEERARAGAADAVHVGFEHASVTQVDELGVLATDLDDRETAAVVGVETHGGRGVGHDLVQHRQARGVLGVGRPHHGGDRVAAGAGQADGHDRVRATGRAGGHELGDQAFGRLDRVAVGPPVDVGQNGAVARVEQQPFRAR